MDPAILSRTVDVAFMGVKLRIVGREDFIAMTCFVGGAQNVLDAQSAFDSAQGPVDLDLLRAVIRRFGREAADKLEQVLGHCASPAPHHARPEVGVTATSQVPE